MPNRLTSAIALAAVIGFAAPKLMVAMHSASAAEAVPIALLSATMQNDNQAWVPTSDAERQRIDIIKQTFKTMLEESGKYRFIPLGDALQQRIDKNQQPGKCNRCEIAYGKEVGAHRVAWIYVQKVSELILNLNVYIKDVNSGQTVFQRSVDLRGNNDEAWQRSMRYLVKNYLLPPQN